MQTLEPPLSHFLSAATGWVELGNLAEARIELERIPAPFSTLPIVLDVRWAIEAGEGNWAAALEAARGIVQTAPEVSLGWLHRAYALRRSPGGGLAAAWDALIPALKKFPAEPLISYNLSCYACQLGRLDEARELFTRAFNANRQVKRMGLSDPDLEPLWGEIRKL